MNNINITEKKERHYKLVRKFKKFIILGVLSGSLPFLAACSSKDKIDEDVQQGYEQDVETPDSIEINEQNILNAEELIDKLDRNDITLDSKEDIEQARKAYDALSFYEQDVLSNYDNLIACEAIYNYLEANESSFGDEAVDNDNSIEEETIDTNEEVEVNVLSKEVFDKNTEEYVDYLINTVEVTSSREEIIPFVEATQYIANMNNMDNVLANDYIQRATIRSEENDLDLANQIVSDFYCLVDIVNNKAIDGQVVSVNKLFNKDHDREYCLKFENALSDMIKADSKEAEVIFGSIVDYMYSFDNANFALKRSDLDYSTVFVTDHLYMKMIVALGASKVQSIDALIGDMSDKILSEEERGQANLDDLVASLQKMCDDSSAPIVSAINGCVVNKDKVKVK